MIFNFADVSTDFLLINQYSIMQQIQIGPYLEVIAQMSKSIGHRHRGLQGIQKPEDPKVSRQTI